MSLGNDFGSIEKPSIKEGTRITGLHLSGVLPMREANHLRIEFGVLLWHILKHAHIS